MAMVPGKVLKYGQINDMPRGWLAQSKVHSRIYDLWKHMLDRCFNKDFKEKYPTYKDCTCHSDFLLLSNFVKWIEQEVRYNEYLETCLNIKWSIDKDGIVPGNKEYTYGKMQLIPLSENCKEVHASGRGYTEGIYKAIEANKTWVYSEGNKEHCKKLAEANKKIIIAVNIKDITIIKVFNSINNAYEEGFTAASKACRGKYMGNKTIYKGYKWFYAIDLLGVMNYLYKGGGAHGAC